MFQEEVQKENFDHLYYYYYWDLLLMDHFTAN